MITFPCRRRVLLETIIIIIIVIISMISSSSRSSSSSSSSREIGRGKAGARGGAPSARCRWPAPGRQREPFLLAVVYVYGLFCYLYNSLFGGGGGGSLGAQQRFCVYVCY